MRFYMALLLLFFMGCKKDKAPLGKEKPRAELLTQTTWVLAGSGFDDNQNGLLDSVENATTECQKDNSYLYNSNGTGVVNDNQLSCGGAGRIDFYWQLINNDTEIKFDFQSMFVKELTKDKMILSPNLPWLTVPFIIVYKH